jgi:hypothetical protein
VEGRGEDKLHIRFKMTWQQKKLLFDATQSVTAIYFRLRITQNWGHLVLSNQLKERRLEHDL